MPSEDFYAPTESALLRFPGSVPGVLRMGSPVLFRSGDHQGVILSASPLMVAWCGRDAHVDHFADAAFLDLDLTDATGRAHLAWWLAEALKFCRGCFSAVLIYESNQYGGEGWWLHWWGANGSGSAMLHEPGDSGPLLDVDERDPRLLPDGSRLVDALALSLVARHVAGLPEVTP